MKKILLRTAMLVVVATSATAQTEPDAGSWKPWFIHSVQAYRLPPPPAQADEIKAVRSAQENLDVAGMQQILYWSAGAPGYRWYNMSTKLWTSGAANGTVANVALTTAIYDATLAAWDTKYAYRRSRPFEADKKIKLHAVAPASPSYPCEHSVAAGVAVTVISHFYPHLKDSVARMADRAMASRVAAGVAFPSDTRAGFELGKKVAEKVIDMTRDFMPASKWDGKMPQGPGYWNGKNPMMPNAGQIKTVVLSSGSEFRPGPPPDFAKEMEELKNFKHTFRSRANAFHYAAQNTGDDLLTKKLFEYNLHLNPPRAARIYAAVNVAYHDTFVACFDAKYAYWGIRPDQYDTTYTPLVPTPPFPGYPSGHASMGGVIAGLFPYFFPAEKALFEKIATDGAESRFHAGIHFRTDNNVGLELGRKIGAKVVERLVTDGADRGVAAEDMRSAVSTKTPKKP